MVPVIPSSPETDIKTDFSVPFKSLCKSFLSNSQIFYHFTAIDFSMSPKIWTLPSTQSCHCYT